MTRAATAHMPPRAVMAGFAFVILGIAAAAAVDTTPQPGIPPGVAACMRENRTMQEIVRGGREQGFFSGGLGGMSNGAWATWGCWRKHACLDSIGLANKGEAVCYKQNSADGSWMLWGLQREIGIGCSDGWNGTAKAPLASSSSSEVGRIENVNLARSCYDVATGTYTKQCRTASSSVHRWSGDGPWCCNGQSDAVDCTVNNPGEYGCMGPYHVNDGQSSLAFDPPEANFISGIGSGSKMPWWRVDLGANSVASVVNVTVYNRNDYCGQECTLWLEGYSLYVGNSSDWTQNVACAEGLPAPMNAPPNNFAIVPCRGVGRYLHLVIPRNGATINVVEVMVWGSLSNVTAVVLPSP